MMSRLEALEAALAKQRGELDPQIVTVYYGESKEAALARAGLTPDWPGIRIFVTDYSRAHVLWGPKL